MTTTSPPSSHWFPSLLRQPYLRMVGKIVLDVLAALLAMSLALRWLSGPRDLIWNDWIWVLGVTLVGLAFRTTQQHYRAFGIRDLAFLMASLCTSLAVLGSILLLVPRGSRPHAGVYILATPLAHMGWIAIRMSVLLIHERLEIFGSVMGKAPKSAVIVGGGRAGLLVAQELKRHPELGERVVGFLDDALDKQGLRIQGIPVLGTTNLLPTVLEGYAIGQVILAIPSASGARIRHLSDLARQKGVPVKTVPGIYRLLRDETWKPGLQELSIEDLLRRDPIQLDHSALGDQLRNTTVLITGGGGSIGSEVARQVAAFGPARLVLLGRGEGSLWAAEQDLRARFPGLPIRIELCDIRNRRRLNQAFRLWNPDVVFHAAAHKHVPYLEEHPEEAVENNIFGTRNVLEASLAGQVPVFVNISTDKAINPANVLGASKYLAERLVLKASHQAAERMDGARYVSVRFGNVLGSRGSVIPIFQRQIKEGGPLTVTHPEMQRYFMTIPEASQLVLQAGLLGGNGCVYVLDMGDPVRIVDLATDMARLAGLEVGMDIEIKFTGLRPGEKLFEELFNHHDTECVSIHPKVREAHLKPLDPEKLDLALEHLFHALHDEIRPRRQAIVETFMAFISGYEPSRDGIGKYVRTGKASVQV